MAMPVAAPVQSAAFDLAQTLVDALQMSGEVLRDGDVLAAQTFASAHGREATLEASPAFRAGTVPIIRRRLGAFPVRRWV